MSDDRVTGFRPYHHRLCAPRWLVERKSLKLRLHSFRNHGAFYEDFTLDIGKRLVSPLDPSWMPDQAVAPVVAGANSVSGWVKTHLTLGRFGVRWVLTHPSGADMQRIMIIGGPGSGKSTLARVLGGRLGLPVVHFDPMFWAPGWVQRSRDDSLTLIRAVALEPAWVQDGNHSDTYDLRAERADLIIYLDLPRGLRVWRIVKRRLRYHGRTRPGMPADCPERLNWEFLIFVWNWDRTGRPKALTLLKKMSGHTRILHATSRRHVRDFLANPNPM